MRQEKIYLEYLLNMEKEGQVQKLTPDDRETLRRHHEWIKKNPVQAKELDSYVGEIVALCRDMKTTKGTTYPKDMRFKVTAYTFGRLIGIPYSGLPKHREDLVYSTKIPILLALDWVYVKKPAVLCG